MPWAKLIDRRTSNTFQISEGLPTAGLAYTEAKFGEPKNRNGVQGSRSGESTRFPPMWSRIHSHSRSHTWVEFVLGSLHYSEGFSSRYSGVCPLLKIQHFQIPIRPAFKGQRTKAIFFVCHLLEIIEGCWFFQDFSYSIARQHCFGVWHSRCFSVFHSIDSISQIKQFQWDFGIKKCPKNVLAKPNNSGPGSSLWPWHALRSPFREADYWENIVVSGSSGSGR